jgi:heparanase
MGVSGMSLSPANRSGSLKRRRRLAAAINGPPPSWTASRYLDQLGRLAKRGVQVIAYNTLASSDYGLLDENTFTPRPNYWAAMLWRRLMGTSALHPGPSHLPSLHLYAHCLRGVPGGVALLVINTDRTAPQSLELATAVERYTLTAKNLSDTLIQLNGSDLKLGTDDALPPLAGTRTPHVCAGKHYISCNAEREQR